MPSALFYVGCCNRKLGYVANPAGEGIAAFSLDLDTGAATPLGVTKGIDNPTFVAVAPDGKSLAAVSEVDGWNEGLVTGYAIGADGGLTYLDKQPTRGDYTCHLGHDRSGRFLGIANYSGLPMTARPNKSFAIYPRDAEGAIAPLSAEVAHEGQGPNAGRQERPHAHCIRWTPDNRFVVVSDLGIDKLMIYRFDAAAGTVAPHGELAMPPGSGPRHFVFHPTRPFAYAVNELTCTLASLAFDAEAGTLTLLAVEPSVPADQAGTTACSAIAIGRDGRHVFAGNRFHDSISSFAVGEDGIARRVANTPCGGKVPRDFAFDPSGTILAVANQESDRITLFRYRGDTGALEPFAAPIPTGSPTAIAFHPNLR